MAPVGTAPATAQQQACAVGDVRLRSLVSQVRDLVGGLDPDAVPAAQAVEVWDLCGELARLGTGAQTLVARRVAEAGVYKTAGARDTAEFLALRSGVSKSAMAQMLATSHRLARQPVAADAVRRGELSADQAHAVTDAAGTDLSEQERLVGYARGRSLKELRDEALRTKAVADPTPEATRRRQHEERHFRQGTGADGRWWFKGEGPPEDRARFEAALNPFIEAAFRGARGQGRRESRDVLAYDALQALACHAHHSRHAPTGEPDRASDTNPNTMVRPPSYDHPRDGESPPRQEGTGGPRSGGTTDQNNDAGRGHNGHGHSGGHSAPGRSGDPAGGPAAQGATDENGSPSHGHPGGGPARNGARSEPLPRKDIAAGSAPPRKTLDRNNDLDPHRGGPHDGGASRSWSGNASGGPSSHDDPRDGESPPQQESAGDLRPPETSSGNDRPVQDHGPRQGDSPHRTKVRRRENLSLLPVLRVDLAALQRGYLVGGEVCEVSSNGPLTVGAAQKLLGDSIVKVVLTRNGDVVTVAHLGRASSTPALLAILHADVTTLAPAVGVGGAVAGDGACRVPGVGAVERSAARRLLGHLDGVDVLDRVLARGRDVASLVHAGRQPTVAQRTALLWAQPACSVQGCPHTFTQIDHRHEWHKQNQTELANLDRLCAHHHQLKTHHNYQLVPGTGDRAFVSPEDPRHPDNQSLGAQRDRAPPQAA